MVLGTYHLSNDQATVDANNAVHEAEEITRYDTSYRVTISLPQFVQTQNGSSSAGGDWKTGIQLINYGSNDKPWMNDDWEIVLEKARSQRQQAGG